MACPPNCTNVRIPNPCTNCGSCEVNYDADCIFYTGQDYACSSIFTDYSLQKIINVFSQLLCILDGPFAPVQVCTPFLDEFTGDPGDPLIVTLSNAFTVISTPIKVFKNGALLDSSKYVLIPPIQVQLVDPVISEDVIQVMYYFCDQVVPDQIENP